MNLDDILKTLRETLLNIHKGGKSEDEWEIRMDFRLLDAIEWHLTNYRKKGGNPGGRPKPQAQSEYKEWKEGIYNWSKSSSFEFNEESFRKAEREWRRQEEDFLGGSHRTYDEQYKHETPKTPERERPWPEVLGVRGTATKPEIEKAYRRLAMRYHPDRKPEGNTRKFQEINAAYQKAKGGK